MITNELELFKPLDIEFKGQDLQDQLVIIMTNGKKNGVFLDIGAANGISLSNTYCLEKNFSWDGICVEPNPGSYKELCRNRNANCLPYAFYKKTGEIVDFIPSNMIGTINGFHENDCHASARLDFLSKHSMIKVITANPEEILDCYNFPQKFDFLSLDVEGTELDILEHLNLSKFQPSLACIEHNYNKDKREKMFNLLSQHGYMRAIKGRDDWYYNFDILKELNPNISIDYYEKVIKNHFCK